MIQRIDDRFRLEAKTYCLRFTCESCSWFDAERLVCSHSYPNEQHRAVDLDKAERVVFCKEFELA